MSDLLGTLRAFDNFFLLSYDVDAGVPLSAAMLPAQRRQLESAVAEMFRTATESDWSRLLSILDPELLKMAPCPPPACQPVELPATERLTRDELLALVDYLHPHTCHFIVINGGLRLSRFWNVHGVADASRLLSVPYLSALEKLQRSGLFVERSGCYAKGIVAQGDAGALSSTLEFLADRGGRAIPPHPVSATRWHEQSFSGIVGRPEDTTLVLHAPEAIDVGPFHGAHGKALGEVILLPKPWRLQARRPDDTATFHLDLAEPALCVRSECRTKANQCGFAVTDGKQFAVR